MAEMKKRFSRRTVALFWCAAIAVLIGGLIYAEQIAFLYVLATLVIVALLVVVGRADLENVGRESAGFASGENKV
jgi:4-amino-4-deoxy-L-arabinose transferase-like glycosyltransferase